MPNSSGNFLIIGGGIIGAFTAFYLARAGNEVTLVESHSQLFLGSTAAAFGSLTPYSDPFFRGAIGRFAATSVSRYRNEILPLLSEQSSPGIHISEGSLLHLFENEYEAQKYTSGTEANTAQDHVANAFKLLSRAEALRLEPNITPEFHSAIEYVEPWIDLDALLHNLAHFLQQQTNIQIIFGAEVMRIRECANGIEVTLNVPPKTQTYDAAVLATGGGFRPIAGIPNPRIELIRGDGAVAVTQDRKPLLQRHVYMGNGFVTPRNDGRHLLGATYERTHVQKADHPAAERASAKVKWLNAILTSTQRLVPLLAECEVNRLWHGWRPSTPSGVPFVGKVAGQNHLFAAVGFIGLGITMAPAVGAALADALCGRIDAIPDELSTHQADLWGAS